jgi:transposase-like protein
MARKRRQFSREFKEQAVELASRPGVMYSIILSDSTTRECVDRLNNQWIRSDA